MLLLLAHTAIALNPFGRQQGLHSPLVDSPSTASKLVLHAGIACPKLGPDGQECNKYVPYGKQYSCASVKAIQAEIGGMGKKPMITQGPERADGPGARAFAMINVMVLAEALGFEYVYTRISMDVPHFGPTDLKGQINWETFLNMGAQYKQRTGEVNFRKLDDVEQLLEAEGRMITHDAYELGHAYTFLDHPCWHDSMWNAYAKVSATLSENYKQATVERPKCPYDSDVDTVHVAIHMRRGDVMKGDPEEITRCGEKIFPVLPNAHPRWKSYWMEVSDRHI
jgi:hypothetical protein